jgi:hypothetical protein
MASYFIAPRSGVLIESPVNSGDFRHPTLPFAMFQLHDLIMRPMEVIGEIGYLLE